MRKSIVTVADFDQEYLDYLFRFFRSSEFQQRYTLKTFTDRSKLETFLIDHKTDILLSHPDLLPEDKSLTHSSIIINLLEIKPSFETAELYSVYKFQPFRQLFQNISDLIGHRNHYILDKSSDYKAQIITFFSPVGGVGKTTIALNLAKLLGENDHRVFYLNLEDLNSVSTLFEKEKDDPFSRLIYELYSQSERLNLPLERIMRFDSNNRVYYLPPLHNPMEIQDLTDNLTERLISLLIQSERFDYILLDLESSSHDRILRSLELSNLVFWVLSNEWNSHIKNQLWLELLHIKNSHFYQSLLTKTYYVINKHIGDPDSAASDSSETISLPYIPEWKHTEQIQSVLNSSIYRQELYKLYSRIRKDNLSARRRGEVIDTTK